LVFEDDANVIGRLSPALAAMQQLENGFPLIMTLYSDSRSVLERKTVTEVGVESLRIVGRYYLPPDSAVAYIMNKAAIDVLASKSVIEGLADWPPWAHYFDFWAYYPWPVTHPSLGSVLHESRSQMHTHSVSDSKHKAALAQFAPLIKPQRIWTYSKSLGSFALYLRCVIYPRIKLVLRRHRNTSLGTNEDSPFLR
jgi:hypothetical protein